MKQNKNVPFKKSKHFNQNNFADLLSKSVKFLNTDVNCLPSLKDIRMKWPFLKRIFCFQCLLKTKNDQHWVRLLYRRSTLPKTSDFFVIQSLFFNFSLGFCDTNGNEALGAKVLLCHQDPYTERH